MFYVGLVCLKLKVLAILQKLLQILDDEVFIRKSW